MSARILVTICTYNERANIVTLVPEIRQQVPQCDVLVVDDSSPDGTADVVRELRERDPQVDLLLRTEKSGLGAATLAGFAEGIRRDYDWLINMDADWSHPPSVLPQMVVQMEAADVIVASRYIKGGGVTGWPWQRHFMSWGINWYSRLLLGVKARDCSGAFRAYRVAKLREIDFAKFRSKGYAFQEEMLYRCQRVGCRIVEIPFTFADRTVGQSKINVKEIVRALWDLAMLSGTRWQPLPPPPPQPAPPAQS